MAERVTFTEPAVNDLTKSDADSVIEGVEIVEDGKTLRVQVSAEQAEAVKALLAKEKEDANKKPDNKPEWLGDFENPEAMAKAYAELRTKMSSGDTKTTEEAAAEVKAAEDAAAAKGISIEKYVEEWGVNQKLADESYAELAKAGFTKEIVDNYIAGRISVVEGQTAELYEVVGNKEDYATLLEWGKANLPVPAQQAYDRLLNAGDYDAAKLALRGFVQEYVAANGDQPKGVNAAAVSSASQAAQPFASKAEMVEAINDRRYKNNDKAYIQEVERRIMATNMATMVQTDIR